MVVSYCGLVTVFPNTSLCEYHRHPLPHLRAFQLDNEHSSHNLLALANGNLNGNNINDFDVLSVSGSFNIEH